MKGEKKWIFKQDPTECIRGLKNTVTMVDLLCKVLIPTQNLINFSKLYNNQLNTLIKSLLKTNSCYVHF